MDKVNKELLERYIKELKEINPVDEEITFVNILKVFNLIQEGAEVEELFHSPMMYYSVFILVRKAYLEQLVKFDNRKIYFTTNDIDLDKADFQFLHLEDAEYSTENIELAKQIIEKRDFDPSLEYYQSYNTFDSLKRRFKVMGHNNDIEGKSVIFLGDDELYSVFYALNANAKEIAVVDIDDRILNYIEELNKEYGLEIKTYKVNLLEGIPKELYNRFDVFFVSGLKDLGGLMVFITTGLVSLKEEGKKSGYFVYYEYENDKLKVPYEHQLQQRLIEMNCYIDTMIPCDEIKLSNDVIDETIKLIETKKELKLQEDYLADIKDALRKDNPLSADPNYPLFSMKPAKLAKISTTGIKTNTPNLILKSLRSFYKKK